jgi:[ribosomal protein S18]-alanine N-acetyltransferase
LIEAAEAAARQRRCHALRLEVHTHNDSAIRLYERLGYHRFGPVVKGFYENGTDAYRYEKILK